jgi:hypothetical protein
MSRETNRNLEQRRINRKRREARARKIRILVISALVLTVLLVALLLRYLLWNPLNQDVVLEAGDPIRLELFISGEKAEFVTDVSKIDTSKPAIHTIVVNVDGREFETTLNIRDTKAPTAEVVELSTKLGILPEAKAFVKNIQDCSAVLVSYKTVPDVSVGGTKDVEIILKDSFGNITEVASKITVITDEEPPVISGAKDIEIFLGGTVSYRTGITVTDNEDPNPTLTIDNSKVNLDAVGNYEVTYIATDATGNSSSVTITLKIKKKPADYVDEETVIDMAKDILAEITDDSMSKQEIAFAIYKWTWSKITYMDSSDKSSWVKGAYYAFKNRKGDCFNYFAAAKALYIAAGIDNVDIEKSDTSHSRHYWSLINLGDGWYHVDCTPRKGNDDKFFMVTDEELEAYSKKHSNSHIFDKTKYPERATKSIQDNKFYTWRWDV